MKYYIISGEASGDLHASNLMKSLKTEDKQETPAVLGKDKKIYLRFGNVKFNAQLLRLPDQE